MTPIGVTHTGKLGDFYFALPLASWLYKISGRKIHWVLAKQFPLFAKVRSLLMLQEMTAEVSVVDWPGFYWALGGQPWEVDPNELGITLETYYNVGYPGWPDLFVSQYFANYATDGEWDRDFVLNLGPVTPTDEIVCTEHKQIVDMYLNGPNPPRLTVPDMSGDVLPVLQRFTAAKTRCCGFSSVAVAMMFANLPFKLYGQGFPKADFDSFFGFRRELYEVVIPPGWLNPTEIKHTETP